MNKYNKEQLEKLSDFELSSMILWGKHCAMITGEARHDYPNESRAIYPLKITSLACASVAIFDINNWADMGPLLNPNNISISYEKDHDPCAFVVEDGSDYIGWGFDIQCFHKNELRAAAIVYILVAQGGE